MKFHKKLTLTCLVVSTTTVSGFHIRASSTTTGFRVATPVKQMQTGLIPFPGQRSGISNTMRLAAAVAAVKEGEEKSKRTIWQRVS